MILVDDDSIMRQYLKSVIDWEKEGFKIIGEAEDGAIAFSLIKELSPDIVITDIDMPVMNGVELIKKLHDEGISTTIIALSCYDDFEYVKQAMKFGAAEYVLKHKIEPPELLQIINSTIDNRTENNGHVLKQYELYDFTQLNFSGQRLINSLISGAANYESRDNVLVELAANGIQLDGNNIVVAKGQIDYYDKHILHTYKANRDLLTHTTLGIIQDVIRDMGKGGVSPVEEGKFVIFMSFGKERSRYNVEKAACETVARIQHSIKKYMNKTTTFGISTAEDNIFLLESMYMQANKALQYKIYKGVNSIIRFSELSYSHKTDEIYTLVNELRGLILSHGEVGECIGKIFDRIRGERLPKEKFDFIMHRLLSILIDALLANGICEDDIAGRDFDLFYGNMFYQFEVIEDFRAYFIDIYDRICRSTSFTTSALRKEIIEAIKYINENISRIISLKEIADHVNLSRTYFSQLFKQSTGENVTDCISRLKIEMAKKFLLDPNYKVYEVAMDIGFESQYYFNKLFKSLVGLTPTEYRNIKLYKT
jgi:two-component system response regulator YesN